MVSVDSHGKLSEEMKKVDRLVQLGTPGRRLKSFRQNSDIQIIGGSLESP